KGAEGKEGVLQSGVAQNNLEMVKLALGQGGIKAETLASALGNALRNSRTAIAEALKAAGAVPPPKPDFQVDAGTLARYAGAYRDPRENEFLVEVKDTGSSTSRARTARSTSCAPDRSTSRSA